MGPMLIFDKSALESLNMNEAVWFDMFFLANITPLFYVETLADLHKTDKTGRTGERIVGDLAGKTPINGTFPNIHHHKLLVQDLLGNAVEMSNRPLLDGGQPKKSPDGEIGFHFDEFPEQAALDRWYSGEFNEIERSAAQGWRDALSNLDFDATIDWVKNIVPTGTRFSDLADVKRFVDKFVQQSGLPVLHFALQLLGVPVAARPVILARYERLGRPPLSTFAPYAAYVLKVEAFFYLCLQTSFISRDRPSNKADIAYLYYLPFCSGFISKDGLHSRVAELFMEHGQQFVDGQVFKQALTEIDDYYSQFADEIERIGVMRFVGYPPPQLNNAVTELWDAFCRPDWRDIEKARQSGDSGMPSDEEILMKIKRQEKEAVPIEGPVEGSQADYAIFKRTSGVRRGKWRIMPPEVEDSKQD